MRNPSPQCPAAGFSKLECGRREERDLWGHRRQGPEGGRQQRESLGKPKAESHSVRRREAESVSALRRKGRVCKHQVSFRISLGFVAQDFLKEKPCYSLQKLEMSGELN